LKSIWKLLQFNWHLFYKVFYFRCYDMLAMLPRLKTAPPHQISSYLTLTRKRISNVLMKGIFGLWSFSFTGYLIVTSKSSCALTKARNKTKNFSSCSMISDYPKLYTFFGIRLFDTPYIIHKITGDELRIYSFEVET
jgi:hypothetical protein